MRIRFDRPTAALLVLLVAPLLLVACDSKVVSEDGGTTIITFTSPQANGTVSGAGFLVQVTATDDDGVDRVEFRISDGEPVTDRTAPFETHVVTLAFDQSTELMIRVDAYDVNEDVTSETITVNVNARTFTKLTTDANSDQNPHWSPDGMSIAWDSDRAGSFDIWTMPVVGGEGSAENLTFGNNDDIEPEWTADSAYLYFASSRGSGAFNIWMQENIATATPIQVTAFSEDDTAPSLSSDGGWLAFASSLNFASPHVYTQNLTANDVLPLTGDTGVTEGDPTWSPAGSTLLFSRDQGLDSNLWRRSVDETLAAEQVTFGSGTTGDGGASWHPDGDRLQFHSDRDGNLDIWVVQ